MTCPYCATYIHFAPSASFCVRSEAEIGFDDFTVFGGECPACRGFLVTLKQQSFMDTPGGPVGGNILGPELIHPEAFTRKPLPSEVPEALRDDYAEAAKGLLYSPKASAALSRRCLQTIIHEYFHIEKKSLWEEIEAVLATKSLPTYLAATLHTIREVGNFAAHPRKDMNTGEIHDVEPGEAEWLLDLLDMLVDHCYVKPAMNQRMKESVDAKLLAVGKKALP